LNTLKQNPEEKNVTDIDLGTPDKLRIRHLYSRYPAAALIDDSTLKEASRSHLSFTELAVQKIDTEFPNLTKESNLVFLQQFFPSRYEFGERFELIVLLSDSLDELRKLVHEKTGCQNISFTEAERYDAFNVLELSEVEWFDPKDPKEQKSITDSQKSSYKSKVKALYPRDGYLILFKDLNEPWKKLTEEERKKIAVTPTNKFQIRMSRKERSLHIKEQDVEIDDDVEPEKDLKINHDNN